jgi:hypothetical protein
LFYSIVCPNIDVPQYSSNQDACQEVSAHTGTGMKDFEKELL